jgi:2-polyprenyl-6-methoxyphenol hydroxylase-like FAD-dependent oxidoreductase
MESKDRAAQTDVLIVGAGPVGLALALDLRRRGVACIDTERNDGVIHHPKATAQNARTMEFFRCWGIAHRRAQRGTAARQHRGDRLRAQRHVAALEAASARLPVYPYCHQREFPERNPPPV